MSYGSPQRIGSTLEACLRCSEEPDLLRESDPLEDCWRPPKFAPLLVVDMESSKWQPDELREVELGDVVGGSSSDRHPASVSGCDEWIVARATRSW
jgi:hypothetical protein